MPVVVLSPGIGVRLRSARLQLPEARRYWNGKPNPGPSIINPSHPKNHYSPIFGGLLLREGGG